jgi:hypothetical protein
MESMLEEYLCTAPYGMHASEPLPPIMQMSILGGAWAAANLVPPIFVQLHFLLSQRPRQSLLPPIFSADTVLFFEASFQGVWQLVHTGMAVGAHRHGSWCTQAWQTHA